MIVEVQYERIIKEKLSLNRLLIDRPVHIKLLIKLMDKKPIISLEK